MRFDVSSEGAVAVKAPLSKTGDMIEPRAELDMVCALTARSAEGANNGTFKPIETQSSRPPARSLIAEARPLPRQAVNNHQETSMSQSGQTHPKADNGGQRPADPKKADRKLEADKGSAKTAIDAGKAGESGGKKDAKK